MECALPLSVPPKPPKVRCNQCCAEPQSHMQMELISKMTSPSGLGEDRRAEREEPPIALLSVVGFSVCSVSTFCTHGRGWKGCLSASQHLDWHCLHTLRYMLGREAFHSDQPGASKSSLLKDASSTTLTTRTFHLPSLNTSVPSITYWRTSSGF